MSKKKTTVFKELLQRKKLLMVPIVANALQAKMVEALGFELLIISGANTAAQIFGLPDADLISMTEVVENIQRICNAVKIPVMCD